LVQNAKSDPSGGRENRAFSWIVFENLKTAEPTASGYRLRLSQSSTFGERIMKWERKMKSENG